MLKQALQRYNFLCMDYLENEYLAVETTACAAAVHSVYLKKAGRTVTLVLNREEDHNTDPSYSGNVIFPFAGRIKDALFNSIRLDRNDGNNSLHGGRDAHLAVFRKEAGDECSVVYSLERRRGEDNLPAHRLYTVSYTLSGSSLRIRLHMESDVPVLCDMTSHMYFNLSGEETVGRHLMRIRADRAAINNEDHTFRELIDPRGTCLDFSSFRELDEAIRAPELAFSHGLNNAYRLSGSPAVELKAGGVSLSADSDSRAAVIYTGGYLPVSSGFAAIEFQDLPASSERQVTADFTRTISFTFTC